MNLSTVTEVWFGFVIFTMNRRIILFCLFVMQGLTVDLTGLEVTSCFFKCPAKILSTYLLYVYDLCVCVLSTSMSTTWVPGVYGGQ